MSRRILVWLICFLILPGLVVFGQSKGTKTRRAAPPKWDKSEVKSIFFDNIFDGTVLVGNRPANLGATPSAVAGNPASSSPTPGTGSAAPAGAGGWAALINSSTIEDEVKSAKSLVDQNVTTPTDFAGKGYKQARVGFTMLSTMFGVIGEYEGDVRWKNDAPAARDAFARAAANAKAGGNVQVFNEAKARKQDLQELIGGGGFPSKSNAEPKANWSQVCDRSPLMLRLEASQDPKMKPWTTDKAAFKANKDQLLHEAQVIATIAEVLSQEGMPDADASEYKEFCGRLKRAAQEVSEAIKLNADEQARKAVGELNKTCDDCHGMYRA